jgi:NTP pyrophosphatase (non-canonical NTP hydrolase)
MIVPLLGLAGESGTLLSEYKKYLRDGSAHENFAEEVREELGDLLWYIAIVAKRFDLSLSDIASRNLVKAKHRWGRSPSPGEQIAGGFYDEHEKPEHQLPRQMAVTLSLQMIEGKDRAVMTINGKQAGNPLSDNRWDEDWYRFHDILHLSFAAHLGWSPVIRSLLKCKRKADANMDEIEDGGRARAVEEGIAALVFAYAEKHSFFQETDYVDYKLLKMIKELTEPFEVRTRTYNDWQQAIVLGFKVWNFIKNTHGGEIECNLNTRILRVIMQP